MFQLDGVLVVWLLSGHFKESYKIVYVSLRLGLFNRFLISCTKILKSTTSHSTCLYGLLDTNPGGFEVVYLYLTKIH